MRKIKCWDGHGVTVQQALDDFNERRDEFGVSDADIISISSAAPDGPAAMVVHGGATDARVRVTIFYWSDE